MINKQLEQINLSDLQALVAKRFPEGKMIEYKEAFYLLSHNDKNVKEKQHEEMLKDISAFANAHGGDLIIGIKENGAYPASVCGFEVKDKEIDQLKRRIHDVVELGVDPRIEIDIHAVKVATDKYVFVIRVHKGDLPPHCVVYKNEQGQFWKRTSSGCTRMDATQVRLASVQAAGHEEKIAAYRESRIKAIKQGQTPLQLKGTPKLVCHMIPENTLGTKPKFTIPQLRAQLRNFPLLVFAGGGSDKATLDGLLITETAYHTSAEFGYTEVRKDGIIEAVASDATTRNSMHLQSLPHFSHDLVKETIRSVGYYLKAYAGLGVAPPVYCFLSLIGVRGMMLYWPGAGRTAHPVDRDDILLDPITCNELLLDDCTELLKPAFDTIWNAGGLDHCPLFDKRR
jgi:hypothetical protein